MPDYPAELNGGVRGLRLGLVEDWYRGAGAHPDLAPAIDAAVEVLRGLGADVEPVRLSSLRDYTDCKTTISSVELYRDPRARSAHAAAGFRPHPAQPRACRAR